MEFYIFACLGWCDRHTFLLVVAYLDSIQALSCIHTRTWAIVVLESTGSFINKKISGRVLRYIDVMFSPEVVA